MALSFFSGALLLSEALFTPVFAAPTPKLSKRTALPDYALTYAPYAYFYSGESFYCSDIATHVKHVSVEEDYVNVSTSVTLETLSEYASDTYLTSYDDVEDKPAWLTSVANKPDSDGYTAAPATIIAVDKGTYVDVRFVDGTPEYIFLSQHSNGKAFKYSALTQTNSRATIYIAQGTHANYAKTGKHYYETVTFLYDTTGAGTPWDVTQNYRSYWYDTTTTTFTSAGGSGIGATEQATEGVSWLSYIGHWGDEEYPESDSRQICIELGDILDECKYVSGPTGPVKKNLARTKMCTDESDCDVASSL
ncbi:MAG: Vacuolar protein sorting-associated protein 62 [Cirrosporium novae-zelandiae]|nr:MAG: Vacuolar protein sorting-associated protein 62 [Cirrosporium novae-zelandiae]